MSGARERHSSGFILGIISLLLLLACAGEDDTATSADVLDLDGDGDPETTDCDDRDADIHHDAVETSHDGIDQDCDGLEDDNDLDGDGVLSEVDGNTVDCDDDDASVYPGAAELCDGEDQDCDGMVDEGADPVELDEICGNGVDDNCDGTADDCQIEGEYGAADADAWFVGHEPDAWSVALGPPGDVTGDGVADLVLRDGISTGDEETRTWTAPTYIYAGPVSGALTDQTPAAVLTDDTASYELSATGDLDGDGVADLALGHGPDTPGVHSVDVFLGPVAGAVRVDDADVQLLSDDAGIYTTVTSLRVGDLNGDGALDLLSANGYWSATDTCARADQIVAHYGPLAPGTAELADADVTLASDSEDCFKVAVFAGDLNGDGVADLAVGASGARLDFGAASILMGPVHDTLLEDADATLEGDEYGGYFGEDVEPAGDVDQDGRDDLWVLSIYRSTNGEDSGDIQLFSGNAEAVETDPSAIVAGRAGVGTSGLAAADMNGDRVPDVLVGSGYLPGEVALLYGPVEGSQTLDDADALWEGGDRDGGFGYKYLYAGDSSGDGVPDVVASDYRRDGYTGGTYIFNTVGW